jgi:hypothetical protein
MKYRTKAESKKVLLWLFFRRRKQIPPLGCLVFEMLNTVNGMTVSGMLGRSGWNPDTSPSEVSRHWQAKIPQGEKYEEV